MQKKQKIAQVREAYCRVATETQQQATSGLGSDTLAKICPIPVKIAIGYGKQRLATNAWCNVGINVRDFSRKNPVDRCNSLSGLTTET